MSHPCSLIAWVGTEQHQFFRAPFIHGLIVNEWDVGVHIATPDTFRRLALSLPNAVESSHMNHPDFRVLCPDNKLRIFATLSGEAIARGVVKLTLDQQTAFCAELPEVFTPVAGGWGRMGMTHVHLEAAAEDTLLGALTTAHHNVLAKSKPAKKSILK